MRTIVRRTFTFLYDEHTVWSCVSLSKHRHAVITVYRKFRSETHHQNRMARVFYGKNTFQINFSTTIYSLILPFVSQRLNQFFPWWINCESLSLPKCTSLKRITIKITPRTNSKYFIKYNSSEKTNTHFLFTYFWFSYCLRSEHSSISKIIPKTSSR